MMYDLRFAIYETSVVPGVRGGFTNQKQNIQHPTSNIQHPTPNGVLHRTSFDASDVGGWMLDVRCWMFSHSSVRDRKSTRLNSSHQIISYAVFCLKKKKQQINIIIHKISIVYYMNNHNL